MCAEFSRCIAVPISANCRTAEPYRILQAGIYSCACTAPGLKELGWVVTVGFTTHGDCGSLISSRSRRVLECCRHPAEFSRGGKDLSLHTLSGLAPECENRRARDGFGLRGPRFNLRIAVNREQPRPLPRSRLLARNNFRFARHSGTIPKV